MINSKKGLVNFSVLFYFITFLLVNQFNHYFIAIIFYFSLVLSCFVGLIINKCMLSSEKILVIILIMFTGIINYFFVGTTSIKNQIFLYVFCLASTTFTNNTLSEKTVLIATWLNIIVVIYRFSTVGFWGQIYTNATSNFVSVYLMYPTVLYYTIVAKKKKKINLFPATIVWLLSLLSRGRGGIISTTIFIIMLYFVQYHTLHIKSRLLITVMGIISASVAIINLDIILDKLNTSIIMEYFIARGGLKSSRIRFWAEYIVQTVSSIKNILFGTNVSNIGIGQELDFNPHNSFIEIHMHNGIFTLMIVFIMLAKNGYISIKKQNYIYIVCMISIMIRAFTDHVFWPAYGTPILFYFMFYYDNISSNLNLCKRRQEFLK